MRATVSPLPTCFYTGEARVRPPRPPEHLRWARFPPSPAASCSEYPRREAQTGTTNTLAVGTLGTIWERIRSHARVGAKKNPRQTGVFWR